MLSRNSMYRPGGATDVLGGAITMAAPLSITSRSSTTCRQRACWQGLGGFQAGPEP